MKKKILVLLGCIILCLIPLSISSTASAQDAGICIGSPTVEYTEADSGISIPDIIDQGVEIAPAIKEAIKGPDPGEKTTKLMLWALALATVLKFVLSFLKKFGAWFSNKQFIRIATLVLGWLIFMSCYVSYGMPIWESVILSLSGPGSIAVHEISKLVWKKKNGNTPKNNTEN